MALLELTVPLSPKSPIYDPALIDAIDAIRQDAPLVDTRCNKAARGVLLTISAAFSAAAKIFYIPIALKLKSKVGKPLAIVSATCNVKAWFVLEMWAAQGVINDLLGPTTEKEALILRHRSRKFTAVAATTLTGLIVAILGQIPSALPAADFAKKAKLIKGLTTLISGLFLPTRSIQLSMDAFMAQRRRMRKNPTLLQAQQALVAICNQAICTMPTAHQSLKASPTAPALLSQILANAKEAPKPPPLITAKKAVGLILTALFEYALARYTYRKTVELIDDSPATGFTFAAAVTASTFYLFGKSIIGTTSRVLTSVKQLFCCRRKRSLGERAHPITNIALKVEEVVSNVFATGTVWIIWGEFFKSNLVEDYFFPIVIATTIFSLLMTSSQDLVNLVTERAPAGTPERAEIDTTRLLQRLKAVTQSAPETAVATLLDELPPEALAKISTLANVEEMQLRLAISKTLEKPLAPFSP
ncbi:MAG: hypothetical protein MRY21_04065 [Simkaniaceae bacterium]|nr:hypothetical protein [Simkaniaceae bacterium]